LVFVQSFARKQFSTAGLPCKEGGCYVLKLPFALQKNVVSPISVRHPLPFRQSLIAIRLCFRLGGSLAPRLSTDWSRWLRKRSQAKAGWKTEGRISWCAEKFFGSAEALPSRKFLFRQSPFATRYSLLAAVSPFAAVSRLADLPISRFADKIRLGRSLALPQW